MTVSYANSKEDVIEAYEYHAERHPSHEVFKGRLASNNAKAVIIMNPDAEGRILVVFKSDKAKGCTRFRTDLEVCRYFPFTTFAKTKTWNI